MKKNNNFIKTTQELSVVLIIKNDDKQLVDFLNNVKWTDEVVVVANNSNDQTIATARQFTDKVFINNENNLGDLKRYGISKATGDWILVLDTDERVSDELRGEIQTLMREGTEFDGFSIPYQNHFLGHPLTAKAQRYAKTRLFRAGKGTVLPDPVHEEMKVEGRIGSLNGKILHYSFRSIPQVVKKFTHYAQIEAPLLYAKGDRIDIKRLTLYPLHMFWSIFMEGEGWRDGVWGLGLAISFAYYEFIRYFFVLLEQIKLTGANK